MAIDLSVVIPVYNARKILRQNAGRIISALEKERIDYEIIFCDDKSRDDSKEILEGLAQKTPCIKYLLNEENQGLGGCLTRLFAEAQGENIIYCDCDLPFGEGVFKQLLDASCNYDIVVASRYKGERNKTRLYRKIFSRLYFFFCWILFSLDVRDIGSGSVLIKRNIIPKLNLHAKGFDIHAEMYVKAISLGFKINEIPVKSYEVGEGSFSVLKHGLNIVIGTMRFWLKK